jgi:hypothetical protein
LNFKDFRMAIEEFFDFARMKGLRDAKSGQIGRSLCQEF